MTTYLKIVVPFFILHQEPLAKFPAPEKSKILSQFAGTASSPNPANGDILRESRTRWWDGKMAQKGDFAGAGNFASGSQGEQVANINTLQTMPKAELHLHLGGSFPIDYLFTIASPEQFEVLKNHLDLIAKSISYHEGFKVFPLISQIVNTEEKIENGVIALCKALQKDRVVYAEIRTGLRDLGHGFEEYLKAVLRGMQKTVTHDFNARLLLSLQRSSSITTARTTVDLALKYRDQGIAGIDISGDSTLGNIELLLPELLRAKNHGLSLVVHMGESPKETAQRSVLELLRPQRIGHGVYLSQEAEEWILDNRIPIEVCLTSSVLVQMINSYDQHPGLNYFRKGHPIVFCTDDPLIFCTTLSQELQFAHESAGLSLEQVMKITKESFNYTLK